MNAEIALILLGLILYGWICFSFGNWITRKAFKSMNEVERRNQDEIDRLHGRSVNPTKEDMDNE